MARRLWQAYGRCDFRELAVPFAAAALDLRTGERISLHEGRLAPAVEASIRPPVLGRPTKLDGRRLVDGGLQSAVPTDVALELGAATVIAVSVGELFRLPHPVRPLSARLGRALRQAARPDGLRGQIGFMAQVVSRERPDRPKPQVEIRPDMTGISAFSPWQTGLAARRGEAAARRALPAIQRALAAASAA
jgi:NTE family protein